MFIIKYASQFPDGFSPRTPKWIFYIKSVKQFIEATGNRELQEVTDP